MWEQSLLAIDISSTLCCSLAANGSRGGWCRDQHGRLLGGPVNGRRDQVVGHGSGRRRRRRCWHGRRRDAISPPSAEAKASRSVHSAAGSRAREAVQAAEIPERARTGTPSRSDPPYAHPGTCQMIHPPSPSS